MPKLTIDQFLLIVICSCAAFLIGIIIFALLFLWAGI